MCEFISFLEEKVLSEIYDCLDDKESIQIHKRFMKNVYVVEFKHLTKRQDDYEYGLGELTFSLESFGCTSVLIDKHEDITYITVIPPSK